MGLKVTNNAFGTLNAGISSGDTVIVLGAGQGARFPVLSAGDYFYGTLIDTSNQLEIVKVTARATDTMTVVRAQDGTSSRAYSINDRFELRPTAALFNEKADDANAAKTDVTQSFTAAQRGAVVALTDGATITPDFATGNNFSVTLGGNRTLANPTNIVAGQSGAITVTQDATGGRVLAFGSHWKFPGGVAPVLTTAASAVDVIAYYVESATRITARVVGDTK